MKNLTFTEKLKKYFKEEVIPMMALCGMGYNATSMRYISYEDQKELTKAFHKAA